MRAGRLRHRVELQEPTQTRTASGGYVETWTTVRKAWAAIEPLRGNELFAQQQTRSEITHRVLLRKEAAFTPQQRILFESRALYPVSVSDLAERNIQWEIMAREAVV